MGEGRKASTLRRIHGAEPKANNAALSHLRSNGSRRAVTHSDPALPHSHTAQQLHGSALCCAATPALPAAAGTDCCGRGEERRTAGGRWLRVSGSVGCAIGAVASDDGPGVGGGPQRLYPFPPCRAALRPLERAAARPPPTVPCPLPGTGQCAALPSRTLPYVRLLSVRAAVPRRTRGPCRAWRGLHSSNRGPGGVVGRCPARCRRACGGVTRTGNRSRCRRAVTASRTTHPSAAWPVTRGEREEGRRRPCAPPHSPPRPTLLPPPHLVQRVTLTGSPAFLLPHAPTRSPRSAAPLRTAASHKRGTAAQPRVRTFSRSRAPRCSQRPPLPPRSLRAVLRSAEPAAPCYGGRRRWRAGAHGVTLRTARDHRPQQRRRRRRRPPPP